MKKPIGHPTGLIIPNMQVRFRTIQTYK